MASRPDATAAGDPLARLFAYTRGCERACTALAGPPGATRDAGIAFLEHEAPRYRQDLEQALFPLLKRRLRNDDDEEEAHLMHTIFLLERELEELAERWPALRRSAATAAPGDPAIAGYVRLWDAHLEKLEGVLMPALAKRLGARDLDRLAQAMAHHRDAPPASDAGGGR